MLKDTRGKLMNILLRSSPETYPKTPVFRKQVKTLETKDANAHSPLSTLRSLLSSGVYLCLLSPKGSQGTCNRGSCGQQKLMPGYPPSEPGTESCHPFAFVTCFLSLACLTSVDITSLLASRQASLGSLLLL
ncbi:hypothetical protein HJG60_010182 [Phyllostomus discolor]|uniref:Uncharacterized protein n=1 Tax=Phyllostomus discolor TaxID=89673 RepID=A0A834EJQ4_9CHIR|nr:hypothetical protein HJG60_010182 [Phyllostomus discolor]